MNDIKKDLSRLGYDVYGGCRCDLVQIAIHEWGIDIDEIIAKLSDEDVIRAVHKSLEVSGALSELPDEEDEEEEE